MKQRKYIKSFLKAISKYMTWCYVHITPKVLKHVELSLYEKHTSEDETYTIIRVIWISVFFFYDFHHVL